MDLEKIAGLVKIVEDSSLTEFTYKEGEMKITMSKLQHPPVVAPGAAVAPAPLPAAASAEEKEENTEEEPLFITSPIVGTFYSAPAPDAPAFVKVGGHVKNGQTVCILEFRRVLFRSYVFWKP